MSDSFDTLWTVAGQTPLSMDFPALIFRLVPVWGSLTWSWAHGPVVELPEFNSSTVLVLQLLTAVSWVSHLSFWSLNFLICKMGSVTILTSWHLWNEAASSWHLWNEAASNEKLLCTKRPLLLLERNSQCELNHSGSGREWVNRVSALRQESLVPADLWFVYQRPSPDSWIKLSSLIYSFNWLCWVLVVELQIFGTSCRIFHCGAQTLVIVVDSRICGLQ